jgi:AraC-like DNA-binding protein
MRNSERYNEEKGHYQMTPFQKHVPVLVHRILGQSHGGIGEDPHNILEHWHSDYEFVLTLHGYATHFIDGREYTAAPGKVFAVNSESIHKILPDIASNRSLAPGEAAAIVIHIEQHFLQEVLRDYPNDYFLPESGNDQTALAASIQRIAEVFPEGYRVAGYEWLHIMSAVDEFLYLLCRDRLVSREVYFPINRAKNQERLRGVLMYVADHYTEELSQQEVAGKFYFSKEYFARFFKECTGMTFMSYVTRFRLDKARDALLSTNDGVLEIALQNGFSDSRGLINAFKKYYDDTPLQYRKKAKQGQAPQMVSVQQP